MSKDIRIKKGLDIKLKGAAEKLYAQIDPPDTVAIKPTDFHGVVPKLLVKTGDEVKAGSPLFYDKDNERVKFVAPVSGEVVEINRGAKRKILEVKILADKENSYQSFKKEDPATLNREQIVDMLLESGAWPFIRQRPYATIANPNDIPKSIFISAFNTAPLAADNDFIIHGMDEAFQAGLNALNRLTDGPVHLNIDGKTNPDIAFTNAKGVQVNRFKGPHPAGNIGVQIHHIDPINKGEVVWYLYPQDVVLIGRVFLEGKFDASRIIALTGSEVKKPKYYKTFVGAAVKNILDGTTEEGKKRFISGDVLTGTAVEAIGYLGFYDSQITVIPEGDQPEFMGWLAPGLNKFSVSRTFFSWLMPNKEYALDTNMHGEERAYVMTGEYERVLPMDIYPMQLLKAIMVGDIEAMEALGIYEVAEEDLALCEVVCTSKINVQELLRQGLDLIKKEFS